MQAKREREKAIVSEMIALYCRKQHGVREGLCADCASLDAYARQRSDSAPPFRNKKREKAVGKWQIKLKSKKVKFLELLPNYSKLW